MATRDRSFWIMLIFILCGLVIGGLLGDLASNVNGLWWLGYAFTIKINIASIIGMAIAIFIYRKIW